jgi:glutamyl-tRNA synthetase
MALFNYLEARSTGGRFILRIEDTDRTRYNADSERLIVETLRWLGLSWDEGPDVGGPRGPYRQSERTDLYREHAARLLANGWAYRCFCTEARLEEMRLSQRARKAPPGYDGLCRGLLPEEVERNLASGVAHVVRFKVPHDRTVTFHDELRGDVQIEGRTIDDQVLLKSDGFPTYHLANVVDDHLMGVTRVIRAEEWIVSTPKHVLLYEAFGWKAPAWRHMPLLRNADKSKISKRKNHTSLTWYRDQGYLPEALLNFLGLMGYSPKDGQEVFDLRTMLRDYDPKRITATAPVFDLEKLGWLNGEHIRRISAATLTDRLLAHFARRRESGAAAEGAPDGALQSWVAAHGGFGAPGVREFLLRTVPLVQERMKTLEEYAALTRCFFADDVSGFPSEDLVPKKRTLDEVLDLLGAVRRRLEALPAWDAATLEASLRAMAEELSWKPGDLFMPLRVAVTGAKVSPPLFESMALLGRDRVLRRLSAASVPAGG